MTNLNFRSILVVVGIFAVGIGLFCAGFYVNSLYVAKQRDDASKVASKFVDNVLAGNSDSAYSLMSPTYQKVMNKDLFKSVAAVVKTDKPVKKASSTLTSSNGTVIYYQPVDGLAKSSAGRTDVNFVITVAKVGGKQQITEATMK